MRKVHSAPRGSLRTQGHTQTNALALLPLEVTVSSKTEGSAGPWPRGFTDKLPLMVFLYPYGCQLVAALSRPSFAQKDSLFPLPWSLPFVCT